ncbi:MAG: helix-hairpin-helix domain-containing protein [Verrucomicrobiales bacterium]|nr:helix-hairpin-helix domain-containing protein [Verrucomicrobiales bacterium]
MKKQSLIAFTLIAAATAVALPLAAASRNGKKSAQSASSAAAAPASAREAAMAPAKSAPIEPVAIKRDEKTQPAEKEAASRPRQAVRSSGAAKAESSETVKPAAGKGTTAKPGRLPARQARARTLMADLTAAQQTKLLTFLNEASVKELAVVNGISTTRGTSIETARPFDAVDEVILVKGIGEGTFAEIVKHGKTLTLTRTASTSGKAASSRRSS